MEEAVDEILDVDQSVSPAMEAFKWWEKRRIWYNVILGATGVVSLLLLAPPIDQFVVIGVLMWAAFANLCFSIGFLLEMFNLHYLKGRYDLQNLRLSLFLLGTGFAALATFFFPFLVFFPLMMF